MIDLCRVAAHRDHVTAPSAWLIIRTHLFFMFSFTKSQRRTDCEQLNEEYELLLESESDSNDSEHIRSHQKWNYPSAYSFLLLLPTSCCGRRFLPSPKRALIILSILPFVFGIMVVAYGGIPPSFSSIKTYEHSLVQHDWSVQPKPSADYEEKYLSFPDHLWGHGFNNILQEVYVSFPLPNL